MGEGNTISAALPVETRALTVEGVKFKQDLLF